jgi:hypothetical protein
MSIIRTDGGTNGGGGNYDPANVAITGGTIGGLTSLRSTGLGLGTAADPPNAFIAAGKNANGVLFRSGPYGANAAALPFYMTHVATAFDPTQPEDEVMMWGYNIGPGGNRVSTTDTAIALALEGSYNVDATHRYTEAHLNFIGTDDVQYRPWSWRINKADKADWQNLIHASTIRVFDPANAVQMFEVGTVALKYTGSNTAGKGFMFIENGTTTQLQAEGGGTREFDFVNYNLVQLPGATNFYGNVTQFAQNVQMDGGKLLRLYSDAGTTLTGSWDGSAGRLIVQKGADAGVFVQVRNSQAGNGAITHFNAVNEVGEVTQMGVYSSTTNTYGAVTAGTGYLLSSTPSLSILADNATGVVKFGAGGHAEQARLFASGRWGLNTATDDGANQLQVNGSITVSTGGAFKVNNVQVLGARKTGWTAMTGTATRSTVATGAATVTDLAERLKALIDDLISHGVIGA